MSSAYTGVSVLVVVSNIITTSTFMIFYQRKTRGAWRRGQTGWHLMSLTGDDWLIYMMLILAGIFPALGVAWWWQWFYLLVPVWSVSWLSVWRIFMLRREQRRATAALSAADAPLDPVV